MWGSREQNFYLVKGEDSNGVSRVKATSYLIDANSMAGNDLPLFLGRTDAFCRPTLPNLLQAQGNHPPVGIFWGQTLWIAGATNSSNQIVSEGYDLIMWAETRCAERDLPDYLSIVPLSNSVDSELRGRIRAGNRGELGR